MRPCGFVVKLDVKFYRTIFWSVPNKLQRPDNGPFWEWNVIHFGASRGRLFCFIEWSSGLTRVVGDAVVGVEVADVLGLDHKLVPRAAVVGVVEHVVEHRRRHVREHGLQLQSAWKQNYSTMYQYFYIWTHKAT